ncbi:hypothetical protein Q8F55_007423 [Vanrija albida]|uniref:Uncharacterized protein n=1 Tax=Vanrija albida TaxID=181172 RepID=A0ABR3PTG6_9TREE
MPPTRSVPTEGVPANPIVATVAKTKGEPKVAETKDEPKVAETKDEVKVADTKDEAKVAETKDHEEPVGITTGDGAVGAGVSASGPSLDNINDTPATGFPFVNINGTPVTGLTLFHNNGTSVTGASLGSTNGTSVTAGPVVPITQQPTTTASHSTVQPAMPNSSYSFTSPFTKDTMNACRTHGLYPTNESIQVQMRNCKYAKFTLEEGPSIVLTIGNSVLFIYNHDDAIPHHPTIPGVPNVPGNFNNTQAIAGLMHKLIANVKVVGVTGRATEWHCDALRRFEFTAPTVHLLSKFVNLGYYEDTSGIQMGKGHCVVHSAAYRTPDEEAWFVSHPQPTATQYTILLGLDSPTLVDNVYRLGGARRLGDRAKKVTIVFYGQCAFHGGMTRPQYEHLVYAMLQVLDHLGTYTVCNSHIRNYTIVGIEHLVKVFTFCAQRLHDIYTTHPNGINGLADFWNTRVPGTAVTESVMWDEVFSESAAAWFMGRLTGLLHKVSANTPAYTTQTLANYQARLSPKMRHDLFRRFNDY